MSMATVNVRYIVDDVDAAVAWYTNHLGFQILLKDPSGNLVELFQPAAR